MLIDDKDTAEVHFLIVEDDPDDVVMLNRALARSPHIIYCQYASNGREAVNYIEKVAADPNSSLPDLILLDIQMPIMTGLEFLAWLRANSAYDRTQVIVLTGVRDNTILRQALALGANAALNKEMRREDADSLRQMMIDVWFHGEIHFFLDPSDEIAA